jgi:queuine tRNA-ribosyltransferase
MRATHLDLRSGEVRFPVFLPDATYGVVRTVDAQDLENCGIEALVMNTFHLTQKPGSSTIHALGGLHQMTGWRKTIITDSGGFQAYSLIKQNPRFGQLHEKGITFYPEGSNRKYQFTPEKVIPLQLGFGSDIVICLDDCTHVDEGYQAQNLSVGRTIAWAKQSKREYLKLLDQKGLQEDDRPLIFAVIQGGGFKDLRQRCADALLEIGFDGFGFGGWPLDKDNHLLTDIIGYTRELIPSQFPMHALGIGHPVNVLSSYELGYDLFDSAMPTRDARHGRLYRFARAATPADAGLTGDWFAFTYTDNERNIRSTLPISEFCDCPCCRRYSLGYLYHLFKQGDPLYMRLATLHNLRFMVQLTDRIRSRTTDA